MYLGYSHIPSALPDPADLPTGLQEMNLAIMAIGEGDTAEVALRRALGEDSDVRILTHLLTPEFRRAFLAQVRALRFPHSPPHILPRIPHYIQREGRPGTAAQRKHLAECVNVLITAHRKRGSVDSSLRRDADPLRGVAALGARAAFLAVPARAGAPVASACGRRGDDARAARHSRGSAVAPLHVRPHAQSESADPFEGLYAARARADGNGQLHFDVDDLVNIGLVDIGVPGSLRIHH